MPADVIGLEVMVGRIATGEVEDKREVLSSAAAEMGRNGGKARPEAITPERRAEIAQGAATKRWQNIEYYNFARIYKTIRMSPAMVGGITDRLWSREDVLARIDAARLLSGGNIKSGRKRNDDVLDDCRHCQRSGSFRRLGNSAAVSNVRNKMNEIWMRLPRLD